MRERRASAVLNPYDFSVLEIDHRMSDSLGNSVSATAAIDNPIYSAVVFLEIPSINNQFSAPTASILHIFRVIRAIHGLDFCSPNKTQPSTK